MSPTLTPNKLELLTQQVVYDHSIVTYRVAARMFKVSAWDAKSLLRSFHEQSEGRTHATMIVSGFMDARPAGRANGHGLNGLNGSQTIKDTSSMNGDVEMENHDDEDEGPGYPTELRTIKEKQPDEIQTIMLIPEDKLEAKLPLFTRILSNDVYSVEPNKLPDLVLLSAANAPVLQDPALASVDPEIIGLIAHSRKNAKKTGKPPKASTSASTAATTSKPDLKRKASNNEVSAPSTSTSTKVSGKSKLGESVSKPAGRENSKSVTPAVADLFKDDKAKKSPAKAAEIEKVEPSASSKGKAAQSMDIDPDEFDAMLADDDDLMAEIEGLDAPASKAAKGGKTSSAKTSPDKAGVEKGKASGDKAKVMKSGVRKTRRVKKRVQTTNAKGFKVTKEVETDESYSGSEDEEDGPTVAASSSTAAEKEDRPRKEMSSTPASSTSTTTNKKKAAAGKPGEQSSLKNFFGKPKAATKK